MLIDDLPELEEIARTNKRLQSLLIKHGKLDSLVNQYNQRVFLTRKEEDELKILKREKLKIKEKIVELYNSLKGSLDFEFKRATVFNSGAAESKAI
ncbi:MAG: hypothetical protein NZO16_03510 [Deltaproteobacteria bacterium]|nr:hypothetical protein [Deltaproteobacteria bacterium]